MAKRTSDLSRSFMVLSGTLLTGVFIVGTGGGQAHPDAAPAIGRSSQPTFYRDVLPILQSHCQNCHRLGEVAPMPLVTYEQSKPWARGMVAEVRMKMMPPWFVVPGLGVFANTSCLTEKAILFFL